MGGWRYWAGGGVVVGVLAAGVLAGRFYVGAYTDDLGVDDIGAGKLKPDGGVLESEEVKPTGVWRSKAEVFREYASDLSATEVVEFYARELGRLSWTAADAERAGCNAWALVRMKIVVCTGSDGSTIGSPGFSVTTIKEANPEER